MRPVSWCVHRLPPVAAAHLDDRFFFAPPLTVLARKTRNIVLGFATHAAVNTLSLAVLVSGLATR